MQTILGLDLGTNSIAWALIKQNFKNKEGEILGMGSRIIPMSQDVLGKFDAGQSISQTAERTGFRGVRRLLERDLLRRERLHRVLNVLGFLPEHYADCIDFEKKLGQFKPKTEPKLPYKFNCVGFEFIFQNSFNEMVGDFREKQPQLFQMKANGKETKIPYDWTIYYLRKKALSEKISKEELAWIILNFNQKRGYYQLRGEEEETEKDKSFEILKVTQVIDSGEKLRGKDVILYDVYFSTGWKYDRQITKPEEWLNKEKEFIVTTSTLSSGEIKRSFKAVDSEKDWIAIKQKTEKFVNESGKTVGEYIYDTLLAKPNQKIRGKLIRTIERHFYKEELKKILDKQKEFHAELRDNHLYEKCVEELYPNNQAHRRSIAANDFTYLFVEDIIFYQRPLKSKKSLISNCSLERRIVKKSDGTEVIYPIKVIAKSHPLYQEFRLLQWMHNLKIFRKADKDDVDITAQLLPTLQDKEKLFHWLNDKKEIDQLTLLKYLDFKLEERLKEELVPEVYRAFTKNKDQNLSTYFRWNYVVDKKYPLNETRGEILAKLKRANTEAGFLSQEVEQHLWHILYSVEDREEVKKALQKFAEKHNLCEEFVEVFKKFPRIEKEYGAFSEKAIKKLLNLMRFGKYWNEDAMLKQADVYFKNIEKLLGTLSEKEASISEEDRKKYKKFVNNKLREELQKLQTAEIENFQNMPLWLASYIIYGRHSETENAEYWETADDIKLLKKHSLRNPIVEQIINETLQTIKEIWKSYGNGKKGFFDEIHVELGREMKNPASKRQEMTKKITENENTNIRIKAILTELLNEGDHNVRPYSPMQQEILKVYEEGIHRNKNADYSIVSEDEVEKIRKKNQPTPAELKRYKLWLEQGYKSPYTGEIIPLSKLFTPAYEIEHIIPQSRYFDDSLSNKVICEAEINSLKDNMLAYEFIKNRKEKKVELSHGKFATLLNVEQYEEHVKQYYGKNPAKMKKLLMDEIPEAFIERQLNDSRYISKVVKALLSNIVREENEEEGTAKKVIVTSGAVTSRLKQDWGLNDVWNDLITPRFERMNAMAGYDKYGSWENKDGKNVFQINTIEPELLKLNKKRIDHRHHALDALIVACSTRDHVNYLNNESASEKKKSERFDLRNKLRIIETYTDKDGKQRTAAKGFIKPWGSFTQDAKAELQKIIVSFKKNNRVINRTVNYYQKWETQEDGTQKKVIVKQKKGDNWAIRKPLHKDTVSALVNLRFKKEVTLSAALENTERIVDKELKQKIKYLKEVGYDNKKILKYFKDNKFNDQVISRVEVYKFTNEEEKTKVAASRVRLDESFNEKKIESITDTGIQKILLAQLDLYKNKTDENGKPVAPETLAFSQDGLDTLNKNLTQLNGGKPHAPIYKVRTYETLGNKFAVGLQGNKKDKYVEAAKGTNLFFAIYKDEKGNRSYETVPLNIVIERQKQGLSSCPDTNENGNGLLFGLSPNDLVYVPKDEEIMEPSSIDFNDLNAEQLTRIYKFVSSSGSQAFFIQQYVANSVVNKFEFSALNKMEKSVEEQMIKSICYKLQTDRLGKIIKVIR